MRSKDSRWYTLRQFAFHPHAQFWVDNVMTTIDPVKEFAIVSVVALNLLPSPAACSSEDLKCIETVVVDQRGIRAKLNEFAHQGFIARSAGNHQRGLVEDVAEIHAILLGLAQHTAWVFQLIEHVVVLGECFQALFRVLGRGESGRGQGVDQHLIPVDERVLEQCDTRLLLSLLQGPVAQRIKGRTDQHRPRHGLLFEDAAADLLRLFLFSPAAPDCAPLAATHSSWNPVSPASIRPRRRADPTG